MKKKLIVPYDFTEVADNAIHHALVTAKVVNAEVPLAEMFGYATDLRSATQGRATFTMEFEKYSEAPRNIAEEIMAKNKG